MAHMQLREALQRLLLRRQRRERHEARLQGLAGRAEPRLDTSTTGTPRDVFPRTIPETVFICEIGSMI